MTIQTQTNGGLYCTVCGELLRTKEDLTDTELDNAVAGFMVDHVAIHGGDPSKVTFKVTEDGVMLKAMLQ